MDEKEYRKALGFANGNPNVVADIGNARCKLATDMPMPDRRQLDVRHFTHAIAEITQGDYEELSYRFHGRNAFHLIAHDGRYFVTGDEAFSFAPEFDPLRGRLKYQRDYYGILFVSGLLHLFGKDVPEKVNALLAHPPADLALRENLMRCVIGSWRFESNGFKQQVKVEYVNVFDEIVGGVFNATVAPDGELYEEIDMGGTTLVVDFGGGTMDFAYLVDGKIDYNRKMNSIRVGGNEAINNFKRNFDTAYHELVADYEDGLPRELIHQIFLDKDHILPLSAGETLDCKSMYEKAVNPIIHKAKAGVKDFGEGLLGVQRILMTGGFAGQVYDELCKQVFPKFHKNKAIRLAEARAYMVEANARGGLKMLQGMKVESTRRAKSLLKAR